MPRRSTLFLRLAAASPVVPALLCAIAPQIAHAAEHVTLRNGYDLVCDHSVADGARVRLYLKAAPQNASADNAAGSAQGNYVEVNAADIVSVETIPAETLAASPSQTAPGAAVTAAFPAAHPAATAENDRVNPETLHTILSSAGSEHHLDVDLLASIVHAESSSHAHAVSRTGAQGLMQLMPKTAASLGVTDSFAPEANVHGGTAYLDSLLKRYHDRLDLALAAYNAGPAAVDRYHGVPPYRETRLYVARIIHEFNQRYTARQAELVSVARLSPGKLPAAR